MAQNERSKTNAQRAAEDFAQRQNPGTTALSDTAFINKGDWVVAIQLYKNQHPYEFTKYVRVPVDGSDNNIRWSR